MPLPRACCSGGESHPSRNIRHKPSRSLATGHRRNRGRRGVCGQQSERSNEGIGFSRWQQGFRSAWSVLPSVLTKPAVAPPQGSTMLLEAEADGVQIYACEVKNARPMSVRRRRQNKRQARRANRITFRRDWKMYDGSAIVGEVSPKPMRLPRAQFNGSWRTRDRITQGSGVLSLADFIRRMDTKGGAAPRRAVTRRVSRIRRGCAIRRSISSSAARQKANEG